MTFFSPVVAALSARFSRLHARTVEDRRGRLRIASGLGSHLVPHGIGPVLPRSVVSPLIQGLPHVARMGEVSRQVAPLTARPHQVEDRLDDLPQVHLARPPPDPLPRQCRLHELPRLVRQVARIACSLRQLSPRSPALDLFSPLRITFRSRSNTSVPLCPNSGSYTLGPRSSGPHWSPSTDLS